MEARLMAADIGMAVLTVKPMLLGPGRLAGLTELEPLKGNNLIDKELRRVCGTLVQWRCLRYRLFEAVAGVALRDPRLKTPEHIAEFVKKARKHGSERFGWIWKRKFFRLEKDKVRRSERIKARLGVECRVGNGS
jgi:hypothetical protein